MPPSVTPTAFHIPLLDGAETWSQWKMQITQKLKMNGHAYTLVNECPPNPDSLSVSEQMRMCREWAAEKEKSGEASVATDKVRWKAEAHLATQEWDTHNQRAFLCILDHCSPILRKKINECGSASEAWAILETLCTPQDDAYAALKAFKSMTLSDYSSVKEYVTALEDIIKELKAHKITFSRYQLQLFFLIGLEERYPEVRKTLDGMNLVARKELRLPQVVDMVLSIESQSRSATTPRPPQSRTPNPASVDKASNGKIPQKRKWNSDDEEDDMDAISQFLGLAPERKTPSDGEGRKPRRIRTGLAILQPNTGNLLGSEDNMDQTKHLPARPRRP